MPKYKIEIGNQKYNIESDRELSNDELIDFANTNLDTKSEETTKPKGSFVKSVQKGLTFGTAPILSGYGESLGTALYNKTHGQPLLEDTGKAFKRGAEEFKAGQEEYEKEKPIAAIAGEVIGGLPYAGLGAGLKGLTTLQKIAKSAKTGAILGGAYGAGTGLSQTKGKILDPEMAAEDALFGGATGLLAGGVGAAIPAGFKKLFTSKELGRKLDYIRPKGTQAKTIENIINEPKIQKEAIKTGFSMNYPEHLKTASSRIENLTDDVNKVIKEAYKDIPDNTKIDLSKTNALGKTQKAFNDYISSGGTDLLPNNPVIKETKEILDNLQKISIKNNSNINFGKLRQMIDFLYQQAEGFAEDKKYDIAKMYHQMRGALVEARDQIPKVAKASKLKHDTEVAKEILEKSLGVKLDNPKNASAAILSNFRDNKGSYVTDQVEEAVNILKNHPETKHLADISDKMKLAQVSYDLRNTDESKMLSEISKSRGLTMLDLVLKLVPERNSSEKAMNLAKRLQSGKITKQGLEEPFNLIKSPIGAEAINKFVQSQKAYGGVMPTMANAVKKLQLSRYTLPRLTIMDLIKKEEK